MFDGELVVDNFAGGGGASTGIEAAIGRPVDIAVNHSPEAIAMHRANHPRTKHYCENIWEVDPREACGSRPVGLAWFSPDCTHFSRAKGGQPRSKEVRALAHVVIRWAKAVRPRTILLENVEEFQTWGPLGADNMPDPARKGKTFARWKRSLMLGTVAAVAGLVMLVLAGVALMLWAVTPDAAMRAPWLLLVVPAVPAVVAIGCWSALNSQAKGNGFATLREQLAADAAMLREVSAS